MSACPNCNSLYSHAPGCRATRPGGPAFGEELTRVFARAIDAACRLDTNPQTVRPAVEVPYQPTAVDLAMMSAELEARQINELMTGVAAIVPGAVLVGNTGKSLLELIGASGDDACRPCHVPTMDMAKPLPDGYWWCDECCASREKGHSCYERKSW